MNERSVSSHCSSVDHRVTCPDCDGSGKTMAMFISYAPGHSGQPHREIPCMFCDGNKTVTQEQMAWKAEGRNIRDYRHTNGIGLREAATRWGLKPSELSTLEQGRADNSNWRKCFGVDR